MAPLREYVPVEQGVHWELAVRPVAAENVPAAQLVHAEREALSPYLPEERTSSEGLAPRSLQIEQHRESGLTPFSKKRSDPHADAHPFRKNGHILTLMHTPFSTDGHILTLMYAMSGLAFSPDDGFSICLVFLSSLSAE